MAERDPRLQLYRVADDCLQRLENDFYRSPLAVTHEWTGFFAQQGKFVQKFDFSSTGSSIEADEASIFALYRRSDEEIDISLKLFRDKSPYNRERDIIIGTETGYYDVLLAEEVPATILPAGVYESTNQTPTDLHIFALAGVGELLSARRAQQLISTITTFAITQMDTSDLEPRS